MELSSKGFKTPSHLSISVVRYFSLIGKFLCILYISNLFWHRVFICINEQRIIAIRKICGNVRDTLRLEKFFFFFFFLTKVLANRVVGSQLFVKQATIPKADTY